jgi:dTDP-4-amino-4,6-dideoxygalactose transaminase
VRRLEEELRERLNVGFCAAFCNGTVALQAALRQLDLSGEVITTPFTFPATVHAIEWNGLTPVFCDVEPGTWNLDPARARELVSERTSALVPVHLFGNPCDVEALGSLAREKGLRVVYDAAHAFDVRLRDRGIGSYGDLSIFSFHATKLFHTGEGGAVVGSAAEDYHRLHLLRNFGIDGEDRVVGVGLNGKMSEVHASLGLSLLEAATEELHARTALAARYQERLADVTGLRFQRIEPGTKQSHAYFALAVEAEAFGLSRNELQAALRSENVIARRYFYPLCSEIDAYRHHPSARASCLPHATRLAQEVLCLPLYGEFGPDGVDRCVDALLAIRDAAPRVRRALAGRS